MRRLMKEAGLSMPTFESNRKGDTFTIRLLLHKFFSEEDIKWLGLFNANNLSESQKSVLIFAREIGAVDTLTYSQLTGEKMEQAEKNLEELEKAGVLIRKGKTLEATYYVLGNDGINVPKESTILPNKGTEMSLNVPKEMSLNVPNINLTDREKLILEIFSKKNDSTAKEISLELGVVEKTIKRDIASLKEKNMLKRIGGKNGGHWEVVEK